MSIKGRKVWLVGVILAAIAFPASAQEFRGRINGVVLDNSQGVLPGATVTATSPALIQPQVTTTAADGTYQFPALPPGVYVLTFELAGFQTFKRENIRVVINTTLSVDASLSVAALQESVTVSGESPVVDTSTTTIGTNFTKELLTEIPNARDIWAALSQAPGFQMTGYDVGGSHTGTQTGFIAYGVDDQRTTRIEGVNTTEDTGANAGYFDFGSFEELHVSGAGNLADQDTPGSSMNITVKSGGERFSGMWYTDWEGKNLISDNVPDVFKTSFQRDDDGFFVRVGLQRGNPIDRQYDINANLGGPLWKRKIWFFYSYRLNDQYKFVLNPDGSVFDTLARSKLSNAYTVKLTYQLNRNNQLIGYMNKREKLQALRDFGPGIPLSAAYYRAPATTRARSSGRVCSARTCSSTSRPRSGTTSSRCDRRRRAAISPARTCPGASTSTRRTVSMEGRIPPTRIRSVSSRSSPHRSTTSRRAGVAITASSSAARVVARSGSSSRISPSTSCTTMPC
jgi:hypothetical protein